MNENEKKKRDKSKKSEHFLRYEEIRKPMPKSTRVINSKKGIYNRKDKDWLDEDV